MSQLPNSILKRARSLVGRKFRSQGRDPDTGLDCVGVLLLTFGIGLDEVRRDYRLRGWHRQEVERQLLRFFRRIGPSQKRLGDVLLCEVAEDQVHLAIDCGGSFIHADSKLRSVVETPGKPQWPIIGVYRRRSRTQKRD